MTVSTARTALRPAASTSPPARSAMCTEPPRAADPRRRCGSAPRPRRRRRRLREDGQRLRVDRVEAAGRVAERPPQHDRARRRTPVPSGLVVTGGSGTARSRCRRRRSATRRRRHSGRRERAEEPLQLRGQVLPVGVHTAAVRVAVHQSPSCTPPRCPRAGRGRLSESTSAPCSRATSAVPSVDPSSATSTSASGGWSGRVEDGRRGPPRSRRG